MLRKSWQPVERVIAEHPLGVLLAVLVLIGLAPHVVFSALHGEIVYYFGAWDEDIYGYRAVSYDLGAASYQNRYFSFLALQALFWLGQYSTDFMYIAADVLFSLACVGAAYYCVSAVIMDPMKRAVGVLFLLFGSEFLSLSNLAMTPWPINAPALISLLPDSFQPYVVNNRYTFLYFYRTPEPQVSNIFLLLMLGSLLRLAEQERFNVFAAGLLFVGCIVSPGFYGPVGVAFGLGVVACGVACAATRQWDRVVLFALAVVCAGASVYAWSLLEFPEFDSPIFDSRAPILSVSVLISLMAVIAIFVKRELFDWQKSLPWIMVGACLFSVIALNQQVITGKMVQPHVWEKSVTHLVLALGLMLGLLCLSTRRVSAGFISAFAGRMPVVLAAGLGFVMVTHAAGSALRFPANERSIMQRDLYFKARDIVGLGEMKVVVPDQSSLFLTRIRGPVSLVGGYEAMLRTDRQAAFEWAARRGFTPKDMSHEMISAADKRDEHPWLMMFFVPLESWWLYSNGRAVDYDDIKSKVPGIVAEYSAWIAALDPAEQQQTLLIEMSEMPARNNVLGVANEYVGEKLSVYPLVPSVYGYLQSAETTD